MIAAYLRDSTVRRIVILAELQLLVPEFIFEEFAKHLPALAKRSGLGRKESRDLIDRLRGRFAVVPEELVRGYLPEATRIMKAIDERDAAYIAAALCIRCDGVWSDDPHLKRQDAVRCWTTRELASALRQAGFPIDSGNP